MMLNIPACHYRQGAELKFTGAFRYLNCFSNKSVRPATTRRCADPPPPSRVVTVATSHKVPLATGATSPDTGGEQREGGGEQRGGGGEQRGGGGEQREGGEFLHGPNNSSSSGVNLLTKAEATPTICDVTGH